LDTRRTPALGGQNRVRSISYQTSQTSQEECKVTVMDGSIFARQNPDFSSFKDSFLAKHELKSSGIGCSSTPIAAANGQKQRVGKFTEKKKEPKKAEFEEIYK